MDAIRYGKALERMTGNGKGQGKRHGRRRIAEGRDGRRWEVCVLRPEEATYHPCAKCALSGERLRECLDAEWHLMCQHAAMSLDEWNRSYLRPYGQSAGGKA